MVEVIDYLWEGFPTGIRNSIPPELFPRDISPPTYGGIVQGLICDWLPPLQNPEDAYIKHLNARLIDAKGAKRPISIIVSPEGIPDVMALCSELFESIRRPPLVFAINNDHSAKFHGSHKVGHMGPKVNDNLQAMRQELLFQIAEIHHTSFEYFAKIWEKCKMPNGSHIAPDLIVDYNFGHYDRPYDWQPDTSWITKASRKRFPELEIAAGLKSDQIRIIDNTLTHREHEIRAPKGYHEVETELKVADILSRVRLDWLAKATFDGLRVHEFRRIEG